jgi:polyisoprenoid-binding protein YceI
MKFAWLSILVTLAACAEDPGKDKAAATVHDAPAGTEKVVEKVAEPAGPSETWKIDAASSKLDLVGAKVTAQHPITVKEYTADIDVAGTKVTAIRYTATMKSVVSDDEHLTEHLLGPDFFDTEKFPTSTFVSTEIKDGSDAAGFTHTVTGDMTIRGKTKRISFPAKVEVKDGQATASSEFSINRKDFDIVYPGKPDNLIQDNVLFTISFVAKK